MVDENLIKRVKNNEKAAFKILYESYSEKIYKTAYMLVNDKIYAQDIVQEVFIKIYININTLKHNSAFNSWIYSITVNCCMKHIKDNPQIITLFEEENLDNIKEEKTYFIPEDNFIETEFHSEIMSYIYEIPSSKELL